MDIKRIEENYQRMSDSEIIRIATTDARGLRPEVFGIIENEIKKRNLNPNILQGAIAQNKEYSLSEVEQYSKLLRGLPCPICGNTHEKLNGTVSHTVKSFIFFTTYGTEPTIACPDCLDKKTTMQFFQLHCWVGGEFLGDCSRHPFIFTETTRQKKIIDLTPRTIPYSRTHWVTSEKLKLTRTIKRNSKKLLKREKIKLLPT
jgi:hypothetical protein